MLRKEFLALATGDNYAVLMRMDPDTRNCLA